ncbi:MAG: uridine diphosphate-N-acetylglucosamine-binding protein YvcK, partial [Planctomycetota bacterium]
LAEMLQYRFEESELDGHSFGNLFITALTRVTGSFDAAVRELNRLLRVRGQVLPATGHKVSLIATHPDGTKSTGEVQISASAKPIRSVVLRPRVGRAKPDLLEAIEQAELFVFGPGSLFTSVIPNLLVPGIAETVKANPCPKAYVANIMTQPGETDGLDLVGHLDALEQHASGKLLDAVVVNDGEIPPKLQKTYRTYGATPVTGSEAMFEDRGLDVVRADLIDHDLLASDRPVVRHHSGRLAQCLMDYLERSRAGEVRAEGTRGS